MQNWCGGISTIFLPLRYLNPRSIESHKHHGTFVFLIRRLTQFLTISGIEVETLAGPSDSESGAANPSNEAANLSNEATTSIGEATDASSNAANDAAVNDINAPLNEVPHPPNDAAQQSYNAATPAADGLSASEAVQATHHISPIDEHISASENEIIPFNETGNSGESVDNAADAIGQDNIVNKFVQDDANESGEGTAGVDNQSGDNTDPSNADDARENAVVVAQAKKQVPQYPVVHPNEVSDQLSDEELQPPQQLHRNHHPNEILTASENAYIDDSEEDAGENYVDDDDQDDQRAPIEKHDPPREAKKDTPLSGGVNGGKKAPLLPQTGENLVPPPLPVLPDEQRVNIQRKVEEIFEENKREEQGKVVEGLTLMIKGTILLFQSMVPSTR